MTARLATNEERRRELLADVAHELRTPLQVIRGSVEGMLDGLYPMEPSNLRPVLEETDVMARLLDDLRTLSMAEAGVLRLQREPVDPRAIAENTVKTFRPLADSSGVALTSVVEAAPRGIQADGVRLSEVLANIVTNAVRHTPAGGSVTLSVDNATNGGVRFDVEDTGPGIPEEDLPFVFDRFVTSADAGGTGLGLAIAKRLVELHGGTIVAGARSGGGTKVTIEIPPG
jgi:two-component system sensor histidine kinase BaeS